MAKQLYSVCLKRVLVHEGGKVDHPRDPGGRTNQGVIQRVYDGFRRRKGLQPRDVFLMTNKERDEIYRIQYWNVVRGDELPGGIDYVVFDGAVNSGPGQSVKWLQRALTAAGVYRGPIDGMIGVGTMAALAEHTDHDKLVADICARRMAFLKALRHWPTFKGGWTRRVNEVRQGGFSWATGSVPAPANFADGGNAKAEIADAKPAPQTAPADMAAAGGAVGTPTVAATVDSTKDALTPLAGTSKWIDAAIAGLVIVGAALVVGGLLWGLYARRIRSARNDALDLEVAYAH